MKVYADNPEVIGHNFTHLVMPSGHEFPRGAQIGEIFHLIGDMPETNTVTPWYSRGTYVYDGLTWHKLNDAHRVRKSFIIGSQTHEIELPGNPKAELRGNVGVKLAELNVRPSHRKATLSGHINFWVDTSVPALVWAGVFRNNKPVGMTAITSEPNKLQSLSLSFIDLPQSPHDQQYVVRVNMNAKGFLFINTSNAFNFDGVGQSVLIIGEDTF